MYSLLDIVLNVTLPIGEKLTLWTVRNLVRGGLAPHPCLSEFPNEALKMAFAVALSSHFTPTEDVEGQADVYGHAKPGLDQSVKMSWYRRQASGTQDAVSPKTKESGRL